jgi:hypothetical protein
MSHREFSERDEHAALEAYRAAACAEADAHFDDRALEAQRNKILARLAHLGHPAKVIRFPKAPSGELPTGRVNRRWISVAAAAGLLIGLLGGQLMPQRSRRMAPVATTASAPSAPAGPTFLPVSAPVDDGLLGEIELVMEMRTAPELRALDELTNFAEQR